MKTISCASFFCALVCSGCLTATVSDSSICDSKSVSFALPPEPAGLAAVCADPSLVASAPQSWTLPDQLTTTQVDFSDPLKKLSDITSDLKVQINQLFLDNPGNEFAAVSGVDVSVQGVDDQGNPKSDFPSVLLAQYTAPDGGSNSELDVHVLLDSPTVLSYLKSGKLQMTITLHTTATLQQACALYAQSSLDTTVHMCVAVSATINKSI